MRSGTLIIVAALSVLGVSCAEAKTRALIVGVSGYPNLAQSLHLVGPSNDARAVANSLAGLGVSPSEITVLADGVSGLTGGIADPGPGTKAAILAGLDRLTRTSKPGDLVVFYFSGHGSQQPDRNGDEQGGADEIFLPYDVGHWTDDGVRNALVDDELGQRVERLLDDGVDVFGIIDACHSATGFRAIGDDDVRSRAVAPADLGSPETGSPPRHGLVVRTARNKAVGRGRAAFFYAAQESEEALEKTPPGAGEGESYGVFTYNLVARLNATSGLTYRGLHQAVMADIKRNTLMSTQTPEIEGELVDQPVLGIGAAAPRRQWPIYGGKLRAGALDGLSKGALLALFDDPAAADASAVSYAVVQSIGATQSLVVPARYPCPDLADCSAFEDAAYKKGRFARLVQPGIDLGLVLSDPIRVDPADGRDYAMAIGALKSALGPKAARVTQRSSGYDIAVGLVDGALAFAPVGGLIDRNGPGSSPRLTLPKDPVEATRTIGDAIDRMARATALQRLGLGADGVAKLGLTARILTRASATSPAAGASCPDDADNYAAPIPAGDAPDLTDCDILSIALSNDGPKPLDVTVLLVGADFSITSVWPVDGNSNRIQIGERRDVDILQMEPNPKASAEERLIFLAVPGVNRAHVAFTDLDQAGLRAMPGGDSPAVAAVRDLLDLGLNDMSRAAAVQPAGLRDEMAVDIKPFLVVRKVAGD